MSRGALLSALGFLAVCFTSLAQQGKHSGAAQHRAATPPTTTFENGFTLSLYRPTVSTSNASLLSRNGPVRAWSDGAQLASETALAQIGMAPLGLFPVAYLAPSETGSVSIPKRSTASAYSHEDLGVDGKDSSGQIISSPLNQVYYTGEVGFVYGQWSGKGNGDYWQNYVWGQAGNDKFQINAGAAFENWSGNSPKIRAYSFSR
jgi:hypothetical protein